MRGTEDGNVCFENVARDADFREDEEDAFEYCDGSIMGEEERKELPLTYKQPIQHAPKRSPGLIRDGAILVILAIPIILVVAVLRRIRRGANSFDIFNHGDDIRTKDEDEGDYTESAKNVERDKDDA